MIEFRGQPAILAMTVCAACAEFSFMWLIFLMAGITILRRHREIAKPASVEMTLITGQSDVFSLDLEGK